MHLLTILITLQREAVKAKAHIDISIYLIIIFVHSNSNTIIVNIIPTITTKSSEMIFSTVVFFN